MCLTLHRNSTPWSSLCLSDQNLFVVRDLGNCLQGRNSKLSLPCHHVAILKPLFLGEDQLSLPVTVYSSGNRCLIPYALCLPFIYLFYCVRLMASLYKLSYSLLHVCSSSAWQLSAGPGRCLLHDEQRKFLLVLTVVLSGSVFITCSPQRWICLEKMTWWMFVNDQVNFS